MRPPAPMTRKWVTEKRSFPVRGLVMYRWPDGKWTCNIELLRITREQIPTMPPEEVAFEVALSALHRHMTGTPDYVYEGETVPVKSARGTMVAVPALAFELAPFLVPPLKKILEEGGGGINLASISRTQKFLARATTGSAKDADAWNMPEVVKGDERKKQRLNYEASESKAKEKAMADRRKVLAKFWLKNKDGFLRRGLVFTTDVNQFWRFNVDTALLDPVPCNSEDKQLLSDLAMSVSRQAIQAFASAINVDNVENRFLRAELHGGVLDQALTEDVIQVACDRLAKRLLRSMQKNRHGIVALPAIERALVLAWDPEDAKLLDEYPFPLAPSAKPDELDRWALDTLQNFKPRAHRSEGVRHAQADAPAQHVQVAPEDSPKSWRDELEINDWVPLEDAYEDDDTIDQRAMQLADHEQSAALRRIRDESGGPTKKQGKSTGVKHDIDYAGLPKDVD